MDLENRVFSDNRVRPLLDRFVLVKADPRSATLNKNLVPLYKSTRFVPEVVFVSPDGEVIGRLESREASGAVGELRSALAKVESSS